MARNRIPLQIPIAQQDRSKFEKIGVFADGKQFAGLSFSIGKKRIAVLHLFDADGNHLQTDAWDGNTKREVDQQLDAAIDGLSNPQRADIRVKLFSVERFGVTFGLVQAGPTRVDYVPGELMFVPPWNGYYG
jgi:hypothetical protein